MLEGFSEAVIAMLWTVPLLLRFIILFLFAYAEGLPVIGSIVPGGTIAILAGSLSVAGLITPVSAFILIAVGSFLGDMTGFFFGKKFKHFKWIQKIITHDKHQKSWDLFDRHIAIITIFGKLIPVVRSTPSLFAAARGVRTRRYMLYSFIGSLLWAFAGVFAGSLFAQYFGARAIPFIIGLVALSILVVLVRYIFKSMLKKKRHGKTE